MKIIVMRVKKADMKPKAIDTLKKFMEGVETAYLYLRPYRILVALAYALFLTCLPGTALAASAAGGLRLLKLAQQASFYIGIIVAIWGIVEMQLDLPGWKGRIAKAVVGYVLILLIPTVFVSLREALEIDDAYWNSVLGGKK